MSRIRKVFSADYLASRGRRSAFVSYVCAGDPDFESSVEVCRDLVESGVDILEIGVPFTDPLADGPTNQQAAQRALEGGMTAERVFELVRRVREFAGETPIVFYTYFNLVFATGVVHYIRTAREAGVDGMLVLDLPPEEGADYFEACRRHGMETVLIVAPTTPDSRLPLIASVTTGFIYYVSREGVTGERQDLAEGVAEAVARVRAVSELPVVVGFGISSPGQVRETGALADGVVVGSAIVRRIAGRAGEGGREGFRAFVASLVAGCPEPGA